MSFIARIPHLQKIEESDHQLNPSDVNGLLNCPYIDSVSINPLTCSQTLLDQSESNKLLQSMVDAIPDIAINYQKWTSEIIFETAHNFFFEYIKIRNSKVIVSKLVTEQQKKMHQ